LIFRLRLRKPVGIRRLLDTGGYSHSAIQTVTCRCSTILLTAVLASWVVHRAYSERNHANDLRPQVKARDEAARRGWTVADTKQDGDLCAGEVMTRLGDIQRMWDLGPSRPFAAAPEY
jgi:hypothetical protein